MGFEQNKIKGKIKGKKGNKIKIKKDRGGGEVFTNHVQNVNTMIWGRLCSTASLSAENEPPFSSQTGTPMNLTWKSCQFITRE